MQRSLYLRPIGLFAGAAGGAGGGGEAAVDLSREIWGGLPLAGTRLGFLGLEAIERQRSGTPAMRRVVSLGDFFERDWGRDTLPAADLFEALRAPRPRLCGLALDRPRIMGILNVTPDSFSDGGRHGERAAAVAHGLAMAAAGADIIDVGGESTRPGSDPVPEAVEIARVIPVIEELRARSEVVISLDTRNAEVMRRAAAAGADMLNDVSALTHDPDAPAVAAESGLPIVLMHAQGDPKTMQDAPRYDNVLLDVFDYLERRVATCVAAGIPRARLVVDPGIGFGKTLHHNLELLSGLALLHGLGVPLMVGASRKRFIGALTGVEDAGQRVSGSVGAALAAVGQGAHLLRVHDVAATRDAITVWEAATCGAPPGVSG
jgi:dihydropteroate synthase